MNCDHKCPLGVPVCPLGIPNTTEDVRETRALVTKLIEHVSSANTGIESLNARLFNGGSGAIPTLWAAHERVKQLAESAQKSAAEAKATNERQKNFVLGYSAAIGSVGFIIFALLKWAASKAGIHF